MDAAMREEFKELGRTIASMAGPGCGFALLLGLEGAFYYTSNGVRENVRQALIEWLARLAVNARDDTETQVATRARLALEVRCAEIGKIVSLTGSPVVLFVFDFGDDGNLAYFTNLSPQVARETVEQFVKEGM